jgi:hypothetical protein
MCSIMAASVVDFPQPVVPVTRITPRSSSANLRMTSGSPRSLSERIAYGTTRKTIDTAPRWR